MDNSTLQKLNEIKAKIETIFSKDKIQEIHTFITSTIEEAQEKAGNRIDAEKKKTLKGTMQFIDNAKSELDVMQNKIMKLMGVKKPKAVKKTKKAPSKSKTPAKRKTSKK